MMGEHCGTCRQLDLLPGFCDWCGAAFCVLHLDDHECEDRKNQMKNGAILQRLLAARKHFK